jgi:hypothetical protein
MMQDTYFHGTGEEFEEPLKGGSYDGLIWTANNPAVAQNYIPASGARSGFSLDRWSEDHEPYERFRYPRSTDITLLKQMGYGYPIDHELYPNGELKSYRFKDRKATHGEIREYLRSLGYDPEEDFWLNTSYTDDGEVVRPKDYKMPGRLFVGHPRKPLNIFDTTEHLESDMQNPAYHMHGVFRAVKDRGYHGIKIHDFAQSKNWGNVNHESVGIFPEYADHLDWDVIPAVNFDWGDNIVGVFSTPEWDAYHKQQILQAHQSGEPVDPRLLEWARS